MFGGIPLESAFSVYFFQFLADFCLVHLLSSRHPGMFHQHFIESIFHFNDFDQHKGLENSVIFKLRIEASPSDMSHIRLWQIGNHYMQKLSFLCRTY